MRLAIVVMALFVGLGGAAVAQGTKPDSNPASARQGLSSTPQKQTRGVRRRVKSDTRPAATAGDSNLSASERAQRLQKRQDALDGSSMKSICSNCDSSGAKTGGGKSGKKRRGG
jgi:hypothetical protein